MKKIKLIVEIESDGYSTNASINGEEVGTNSLPSSLRDAIKEWYPADIMNAIYLAENE